MSSDIIGIGTDITSVERIQKVIERRGDAFIKRLFTQAEAAVARKLSSPSLHLAGRFAAKEAIAKALGTGFGKDLMWKDIEILNDPKGKPVVQLSPRARTIFGNINVLISISHEQTFAVAFAILQSSEGKTERIAQK